MSPQVRRRAERFLAKSASVSSACYVEVLRIHVSSKGSDVPKLFGAVVTVEGLLSRMRAHVPISMGTCPEAPVARWTHVRTTTKVHQFMDMEV
mmetsp:Transcript_20540/g.28706  ORF Transcript_20540/g.28706 Transcript_20540/m.28706 type:complete len:93 (+) Transcript_20540:344-622(+)|eukprot:CAMPEP_0184490864 /NCGR_PEP_ID=MMETSP0113_2-20130426/19120_1 /TAXON_ID=91329 /ORGANISM="Norrisiella sphaerica, Strain BC52" /LENGTH=92 /DNA_ID=CAMNT_0026874983 /DNA_START=400 /DNA_END=678 /DNA_ORIENTATION=-